MTEGGRGRQGGSQGGDQGGRESSLPASLSNLPALSSGDGDQGGNCTARHETPHTAASGDPEGPRQPPSLRTPGPDPPPERSQAVAAPSVPTQRTGRRIPETHGEGPDREPPTDHIATAGADIATGDVVRPLRAIDDPVVLAKGARIVRAALERRDRQHRRQDHG